MWRRDWALFVTRAVVMTVDFICYYSWWTCCDCPRHCVSLMRQVRNYHVHQVLLVITSVQLKLVNFAKVYRFVKYKNARPKKPQTFKFDLSFIILWPVEKTPDVSAPTVVHCRYLCNYDQLHKQYFTAVYKFVKMFIELEVQLIFHVDFP